MPTKPKYIIRVLHAYRRIAKPEFRAGHGPWIEWPDKHLTKVGVARGDTLVLSKDAIDDSAALDRASLVILNEWATEQPKSASWDIVRSQACDLLQLSSSGAHYEIFSLRRGTDAIELHLDPKRAAMFLGEPDRAGMRLALLRPDAPVRVSINGKHDWRAQRYYVHMGYVFEYLGEFTRFEVRPPAECAMVIAVSQGRAKHVDLTARLY